MTYYSNEYVLPVASPLPSVLVGASSAYEPYSHPSTSRTFATSANPYDDHDVAMFEAQQQQQAQHMSMPSEYDEEHAPARPPRRSSRQASASTTRKQVEAGRKANELILPLSTRLQYATYKILNGWVSGEVGSQSIRKLTVSPASPQTKQPIPQIEQAVSNSSERIRHPREAASVARETAAARAITAAAAFSQGFHLDPILRTASSVMAGNLLPEYDDYSDEEEQYGADGGDFEAHLEGLHPDFGPPKRNPRLMAMVGEGMLGGLTVVDGGKRVVQEAGKGHAAKWCGLYSGHPLGPLDEKIPLGPAEAAKQAIEAMMTRLAYPDGSQSPSHAGVTLSSVGHWPRGRPRNRLGITRITSSRRPTGWHLTNRDLTAHREANMTPGGIEETAVSPSGPSASPPPILPSNGARWRSSTTASASSPVAPETSREDLKRYSPYKTPASPTPARAPESSSSASASASHAAQILGEHTARNRSYADFWSSLSGGPTSTPKSASKGTALAPAAARPLPLSPTPLPSSPPPSLIHPDVLARATAAAKAAAATEAAVRAAEKAAARSYGATSFTGGGSAAARKRLESEWKKRGRGRGRGKRGSTS